MHFDDCVIYLLKKDVNIYLTDVNGLGLLCYPYLSFVPVGALEFQETLKWTLSHPQAPLGLSKKEEIIKGGLFVCVWSVMLSELIYPKSFFLSHSSRFSVERTIRHIFSHHVFMPYRKIKAL